MNYVDRIFETMKEKNIKQSVLAEKLNMQQSAISHWKGRGSKIHIEQIPIICEALGVSCDYLITGKETENHLSSEEKLLVEQYRKILPEGQKEIIDFIEFKLYKQ